MHEREYARSSAHRHTYQQYVYDPFRRLCSLVPLSSVEPKNQYKRWRMEDLPWQVTCVNRITGENRDVPYGEFNEGRGYCNQPEEYKVKRQYQLAE